MTIVNDTNEFTLDEVIKLVGTSVIVRPESEEMFEVPGKENVPCWQGKHPVRGFRFDDGIYEIEIPDKPLELGCSCYHNKAEFLELFFNNN